jgi:flagellar motor switch protein FliG
MAADPALDTAPALNGASAAAILLMLVEESEAAAILGHCAPEDVRILGREMFNASQASEADIAAAIDRFIVQGQALPALAGQVKPRIQNVLSKAIGPARSDALLSEIAPRDDDSLSASVQWLDADMAAQVLANEPLQVGAILLALLAPDVAADALDRIDEAKQADLLFRTAKLTQIPAQAVAALEAVLASLSAKAAAKPAVRGGGRNDAAKIVNKMKKQSGERVLRSVKKRDRQMGQDIEDEMFVFENLLELDAKGLGTLMRAVDGGTLALALKGASDTLADRILGTMSARAAQTVRDEMADSGPVKRAEVEDAQREIVAQARALAADGTIMMGGQGDDYV